MRPDDQMTNGSSRPAEISKALKEVAFSLDARWDDVKIDRDMQEIMTLVGSETKANIENLQESISNHHDIGGVGLRAVIIVETFEPVSGALATLISSDHLQDVGDGELQVLLGSVSQLFEDLREKEQRAVAFLDTATQRIASIGGRLFGIIADGRDPIDVGNAQDNTEVLNLLVMRRIEEVASIQSAERLLEHLRRPPARIELQTG